MTRASAAVFAALVAATFGAFFLAHRLKHEPSLVQRFRATKVFSPNGDGRKDTARVSFVVKRSDDVTLAVVDDAGDPVRELLSATTSRDGERIGALWNGRDDAGRRVRSGRYRYRITLRGQGRNIVYPRAVKVDVKPPRPRVVAVGDPADGAGEPQILPRPGGEPLPIVVDPRGGRDLRVLVFRTAPAPALVAELSVPAPEDPATPRRWTRPVRVTWDGTEQGAPARAGTYIAVAEAQDRAGNVGRSAPFRAGRPDPGYGRRLPGKAGITVRSAALEPPAIAVPAGRTAVVGVDLRGEAYRWSLRRVGGDEKQRARRLATRATQRIPIPSGTASGLYLVRAAGERASAKAPIAVQGPGRQAVLVVLPVMTWQGRNPVDDDSDGLPNLLEHGDAVAVRRPYQGLPETFATVTEPLLGWLEATGKRYDLTTDVALARGQGVGLEGHRGVLLAGDTRWLPAGVQRALRRYVHASGRVATIGVDNLRRLVRLDDGQTLTGPTPPATFDALGLRPAPLVRGDVMLTNAKDDAGLFRGTSGQFSGLTVAEPLEAVRGGTVVSSAVTPEGRTVIAAVESGEGLTIHLGLPELAARLGSQTPDPQAAGLLESTWTLLSR